MSAPGKIYSAPLLVNWSLNYSCNFSCEHCYSRFEKAEELPADQVLEAGRRLAQAGVLFANFGGGEPLLRRDLLAVSRELTALGLSLSMNSNGWLLDEAAARGCGTPVSSASASRSTATGRRFTTVSQPAGELRPCRRGRGAPGARRRQADDLDGRLPHQSPGPPAAARAGEALGAAQVYLHNFKCSGKGMEHRFELDLEPLSGATSTARRSLREEPAGRRSPSTTRSSRRSARATPSTASPARPAASSRCTCARTATSPPAASSRSCSATSCATTCRRSGASRRCSRRCGTRPPRASAPPAATTRPVWRLHRPGLRRQRRPQRPRPALLGDPLRVKRSPRRCG